jgi:hypothetical protein
MRGAERYSRTIFVALGLIGSGFALPGQAAAQSAQQLRWCNGKDQATSDMAIDGCTALIKSGKYSGRDLAIAFTNRGSAYDDKRDEDRAIDDHDQAIRSIRSSISPTTTAPTPMAARVRRTVRSRTTTRRSG